MSCRLMPPRNFPILSELSRQLRNLELSAPRISTKYWLVFIAMLGFSSSPVHATVPEFPILVGTQMLVVSISASSEDRQLLRELPTIEMRQRLTAYLSRRLKEENLPVVVEEMGRARLPAGILAHNVVSVFVRADLTKTNVDQHEITIGVVGVLLYREASSPDSYLSYKPMTFFVVEGNRSDLEDKVISAAEDQMEKSVIGPLILLRK
jgi:hypothetical protein